MARKWERTNSEQEKPTTESLHKKELPFSSRETELALVSSVLVDPSAIARIVDRVAVKDFCTYPAADVYEAMHRLWIERQPPDIVMLNGVLPATVMADLMIEQNNADVMGSGYIEHYADAVSRLAERRRFVEGSQLALQKLHLDPEANVDDAIAALSRHTMGERPDDRLRSLDMVMPDIIEDVTMRRAGVITSNEVSTGYRDLDTMLDGGFAPEELIILAARSSVGKTSMAVDFLMTASEQGASILFSSEMSSESVLRRIASRESGVPMQKIRSGKMENDEYDAFMYASDKLQRKNVFVDDTPGITTDKMLLKVQRVQEEHPVSLVVFDYLELAGDGLDTDMTETARMSRVVERLKLMGRICQIPILALSQVSRGVDNRNNKVPQMSDLKWSSRIEQDADKVLMLYLHDYYTARGQAEPDPNRDGLMEIHVAKNRNGPVGHVSIGYEKETFKFIDRPNYPGRESHAR